MKKSILLIAAMFAAFTVSAKEITVDLSKAEVVTTGGSGTLSFASNELTVNWEVTVGWEVTGVEIPLGSLTNITNISFDYQGNSTEEVALIPYVRDEEGNRWFDSNNMGDLRNSSWTTLSLVPSEKLWDAPAYPYGEKNIVKLGIIANPENPTSGIFKIRNAKITADWPTSIDNTASEVKAIKTIKDGQMVIVRDGKSYNALGAEMK